MKGFQATGIRIKELDNKVKTASEKCKGEQRNVENSKLQRILQG